MNLNERIQEIVTAGIRGVVKQGCLSREAETETAHSVGGCYYRFPGNTSIRCAIGHSIPDSEYVAYMEGKSISNIDVINVICPALTKLGHRSWQRVRTLESFQQLHDNADDMEDFKARARRWCEDNNFQYPDDCH